MDQLHAKRELLDYQQTAVAKFITAYRRGRHSGDKPMQGCLCFDEMGLGKTLEALATLYDLVVAGMVTKPTIVLCPPSCVDNWVAEIASAYDGFDVRVFMGSPQILEEMRPTTIVIISYGQLIVPFAAWCKALSYERIVTDDALLDQYCIVNQRVIRPDTRPGTPTRRVIDALAAGRIGKDHPDCKTWIGDFSRSVELFVGGVTKRYATKEASAAATLSGNAIFESTWGLAIFDEAHKAKAPETVTTKAVAMLRSQYRLALTGTPVMNDANELRNIMRYCLHYGPGSGYERVDSALYKQCTIGRRKQDVRNAATPEALARIYDVVCSVNGFPMLQQFYLDQLQMAVHGSKFLDQADFLPGETKQMRAARLNAARNKFFSIVSALQLASLHPALLLREPVGDDAKNDSKKEEGTLDEKAFDSPTKLAAFQMTWTHNSHMQFPRWFRQRVQTFLLCMRRTANWLTKDIHRLICTYWARQEDDLVQPSPKLLCIYDLYNTMRERDPSDKMIVMSNSRRFLEAFVVPYFRQRGIGVVLFCGMSKNKKRAVLESFQTDGAIRVMCAVKSVMVGLNLQMASATVVLCEPGWNDAIDDQAIARVDRKGQMRVPHIYRLLISNSVDVAVRNLQEIKRTIATGALYQREEIQIARVLRNMIDMNPLTALVTEAPNFRITYDQGFLPGMLKHLPHSDNPDRNVEATEPAQKLLKTSNSPFAVAIARPPVIVRVSAQPPPPLPIHPFLDMDDPILADMSADELAYNRYFFKSAQEILEENRDFFE